MRFSLRRLGGWIRTRRIKVDPPGKSSVQAQELEVEPLAGEASVAGERVLSPEERLASFPLHLRFHLGQVSNVLRKKAPEASMDYWSLISNLHERSEGVQHLVIPALGILALCHMDKRVAPNIPQYLKTGLPVLSRDEVLRALENVSQKLPPSHIEYNYTISILFIATEIYSPQDLVNVAEWINSASSAQLRLVRDVSILTFSDMLSPERKTLSPEAVRERLAYMRRDDIDLDSFERPLKPAIKRLNRYLSDLIM